MIKISIIVFSITTILFGLILRFSNLNLPFWGDEYQTINVASGIGQLPGQPGLIHAIRLQRLEMMHPPIFMVLLHFWLKANHSISWIRLLPSLIGLVGLVYLVMIGFEVKLKPISILLMTALTTVSWVFVHYSEEVGTYSLTISASFALIYYTIRYLNLPDKSNLARLLIISLFNMQTYYGSWFFLPIIYSILLYLAFKNKRYAHLFVYSIIIASAMALLYFDQLRYKVDLATSSYLSVHKLNSVSTSFLPNKIVKDNIDYFTYILGATPWYFDATFFPTTDRFGQTFTRQYYLSFLVVFVIFFCHYLYLSWGYSKKLISLYFLSLLLVLVNLASYLGYYPTGAIRMSLFYAPVVLWVLMEYVDMLADRISLMSVVVIIAIIFVIINGLTRLSRVPQRHIGKNILKPIYCST